MSSYDHHLRLIGFLLLSAFVPQSCQRLIDQSSSTSTQRLLHHKNATGAIEIPIIYTSEGMLVRVHVGEPPQELYLLPDTGSDVSWVCCGDGGNAYGGSGPPSRPYRVFDHRRSLTFAPIYCASPSCVGAASTSWRCSGAAAHELCSYRHDYEDGTSTEGYWAIDTVAVQQSRKEPPARFHGVMIGCSSRESTNLADADGVLGLSPGHPSFTSLMASKFGYGVLSYSLAAGDHRGDDLITFKRARRPTAGMSSRRMQHARLVEGRSLFYVEVSRFLIGGAALDAPAEVWKLDARGESGGTILDIGTTLTYVPEAAFRAVYAAFFGSREGPVDANTNGDVKRDATCFPGSSGAPNASEVPEVAIEFEGGAQLVARKENLLYEKEEGKGVWCLGLRPVQEGGEGPIIGRMLQLGYFWEFDLHKGRVGFAHLDSKI